MNFKDLLSDIQLNAIVTFCCERHLRVFHVFSCLFRQIYISQCKFHIINSSHSTWTACTTMYYRFFNIWKRLLKCTYVHLSLFHSYVTNIQQDPVSYQCLVGCVWNNRFNSTQLYFITGRAACREIFQVYLGMPWYSQIYNKGHGWNPLPVGKSVNIRTILRYAEKIPI